MDLLQRHCAPCEGGTPPLTRDEIDMYLPEAPGWIVVNADKKRITREFQFPDFKAAMGFTNAVAELAEGEGHHPDIHIFYNKVNLDLWTHAVGGLSVNDFILAAKINTLMAAAA